MQVLFQMIAFIFFAAILSLLVGWAVANVGLQKLRNALLASGIGTIIAFVYLHGKLLKLGHTFFLR